MGAARPKISLTLINRIGIMNISKALNIAEKSRYRMGVSQFVQATIEHWAYAQTGMYEPTTQIPCELVSESKELTNCLAELMRAHPGADVLGTFFSACNFHLRGTEFYPTPPEVSRLLAALAGAPQPNKTQYYEACCGTGSIAMNWVVELLQSSGAEALAGAELLLEDIDPLMVKACMLQMLFLFESLGVSPKAMSVVQIDVLTRKVGTVAYYATSEAAECATHLEQLTAVA
jgi:hypothetical protein